MEYPQSAWSANSVTAGASKHRKTAVILSILSMGLGQFYNRQYVKGVLFLAIQCIYVYYIANSLSAKVLGLITLGDTPTQLVKVGKIYKNVAGDHSIFMMIYGLIALFFIAILLYLYIFNIRDAYETGKLRDVGKPVRSFTDSIRNTLQNSFPFMLLSLPAVGVLFFTVLPIVFMILMAFTNYSAPDHIPAKNLVDWVGLETFNNLFYLKQWASTFYGVAVWTVIWAVAATFSCYFGGILVALLIQQKGIKMKTFWRSLFIIPYAIPQFISFLVMRNLLNYQFGPINQYFRYFGLSGLPWLNDPFWAKVTVILVNMWVGIPVSMVLVLGILTTIPKDLYEAAEVDGATDFQKFRNITMPFILFSTAPLLIMQFAGNINNFNVIYLLTKGLPQNGDYAFAGSTDLLITWLYKLTLENQKYNIASAIGILIFIFIASVSLWNYRRTNSYKEEDMIQ